MGINLLTSSLIVCLFTTFLFIVVYFSKARKISAETKIYKVLLISNMIGIVLQLCCDFISYKYVEYNLICRIIQKSLLLYFVFWVLYFFSYVLLLTIKNTKKLNIINKIIFIITSIIIIILPYNIHRDIINKVFYGYGLSSDVVYIYSAFYTFISILLIIFKNKKIGLKKIIPIYVFILSGFLSMIIQMLNSHLLIPVIVESFICYLMYFTIENPDMKLLEELAVNKNLLQHSNEEKSNLLFKLTQDVKLPIENICKTSKDMLNMKKVIDLKNNSKLINDDANRVRFIINNVLDINDIDFNKIKVFDDTYDINKLYKELILMIKNKINKEVKLNTKIDKDIPILYGDNIKLKQILYSILSNSIKYTEKGNIEFNINHFIQYDVCRLIININDTGCGIDIDKINKVLEDNEYIIDDKKIELDLNSVKRLINILGGSIFIDSNKLGTKVSIVLDQRIYETEEIKHNKELNNYIKYIGTEKNVLLIDDNYEELNKYAKEIKKYNINVDKSMYGKDILNKIRNNIKYDLIIIDDEMTPYNAVTIMEELNKEENFKTKVIIMLGINKEFIKEHYIKDYKFKDYIIKRNYKTEIERIINKYL